MTAFDRSTRTRAHEWIQAAHSVTPGDLAAALISICVEGFDQGPWNLWPKSINLIDEGHTAAVTVGNIWFETLPRLMEAANARGVKLAILPAGFRLRITACWVTNA